MLSFLNKQDTYAFLLSSIIASSADERYAFLNDLLYALDEKSFKNFITLFEGQTIKIPSHKELTKMLKAILIYAHVDVNKEELIPTLKAMGYTDLYTGGPTEYKRLKKLISQKNLNIGGMMDDFQPPKA